MVEVVEGAREISSGMSGALGSMSLFSGAVPVRKATAVVGFSNRFRWGVCGYAYADPSL